MRILLRDLQANQGYGVRFRLVGNGRQSDWSNVTRFTTAEDQLAPANVTGLTVKTIGTAFEVTWNKVTTNTDGSALTDFKDYQVSISAGGVTKFWNVTQERFDFPIEVNTNAFGTAQGQISVSVSARDNSLNSAENPPSVSAQNAVPPEPTGFAGKATVNGINFTWDKTTIDDLKYYRIYEGLSAGSTDNLVYEGPANNFTWSSIDFVTDHYFKVATVDVFNQESLSDSISGSALAYDATDKAPPANPTWPTSWFTSETDLSNKYNAVANVTLVWNANIETDLGAYVVRYKKSADAIWSQTRVNGTSLTAPANTVKISGLVINTAYNFQVAAVDKSGNASEFVSAPASGTTTRDTTAPTAPSAPIVTNYLGLLQVAWDGKNSTGGTMEADVANIQVHVSTISNFTPSTATLTSILPPGTSKTVLSGLAYDTIHYVKLIAQDFASNNSNASAQSSGTPKRITGAAIEDGAVVTEHMAANSIDGDRIQAQTLSAAKIKTGELAADARIIAGPELGTHAEMSGTGFRVFAADLVDGIPNEVVRLGTDTDDYFAVTGVDGSIKASFDLNGKVTATAGNINGDVVLNGRPLSEHLSGLANGMKYYAQGTTTARSTGNEIGLFDMLVSLKPGRNYTLNTSHMRYHSSQDGVIGQVAIHYTVATAPAIPPAPTNADPIWTRVFAGSPYGFSQGMPPIRKLMRMPNDGITRNYRFLFSHVRVGGAGDFYIESTGGADDVDMWVEDLGPVVASTLTPNNGGGGGGGTPTPVQRYEIQFDSSWSRTWRGNGSVFSDSAAWQGSIGDSNGNMYSLIGWGDLTYYLQNSSIESIQVYLFSEHWYYNQGGTARVGLHGHLTTPATVTLAQFGNTGDIGGFPRGGGQWVNIGSAAFQGFKDGSFRGVTLGPSPDANNRNYYGRFAGGAASKIKIVYYK